MKQEILNIILPVYNEKDSIELVIREWQEVLNQYSFSYSFVICEDGSNDGTKELMEKIKKKYPLIINQKSTRRGYSQAIIDGIKTSKSKYILCVDSDGQCDPTDFHMFWTQKDDVQVLIGKRTVRIDNKQRQLFSLLFKVYFKMLFPNSVSDPSTPYAIFRRKTVLPLLNKLNYLKEGFWWGFVAVCMKKGLSIREIEINHRSRLLGDTQVYHLKNIPSIALRNVIGLAKLKFLK